MSDMARAAATLAEVLERENAALAGFDLRATAMLLAEKRAAADKLAEAQARRVAAGGAGLPPAAARLRDLAIENRRLLERAMAVQGRVLEVIAQAAPRASALAPRYGARGGLVGRERALPVAVAASA